MEENEFGEPKLKLVKGNNSQKVVNTEEKRVTQLDIITRLPEIGKLCFFMESCTCCEGVSFAYYMESDSPPNPIAIMMGKESYKKEGKTIYQKMSEVHLERKWYRKVQDFIFMRTFDEIVRRTALRFHKRIKKQIRGMERTRERGEAVAEKFKKGELL
jgi:hypothetical protein